MSTQKQLTGQSLYAVLRTLCLALLSAAPCFVPTGVHASDDGLIPVRDAHAWHDDVSHAGIHVDDVRYLNPGDNGGDIHHPV